ncbi:MAG: site-specific integrase [Planctomycetales bacterium]|nr:site-specific integrase [Planctomycetales bacterium]
MAKAPGRLLVHHGKQVKLAEADAPYKVALSEYHKVHAYKGPDVERGRLTVAQLMDDFLDWVEHNRASSTYEWYKRFLTPFHQHIGSTFRVANLKPFHIQAWVKADYRKAKNNTRRNAIRAVERSMNWAVQSGYITANPIKGMEKPRQESRETVITEAQYRKALELTSDDGDVRDFLTFLWETGARAEEVPVIEAKHVDGDTITLPKKDSKGKRYNRVIFLNDTAQATVKKLIERHPKGAIFRNGKGKPWNKNSIRCRFRILKRELGMPDLCATVFRHTWATDALTNGMDTTTASILMGHRDPATLARNYQHLTQNREHLKVAAKSARSNGESH